MSRELKVAGQTLAVDKEGYLLKLTDWSPAVAEGIARAEGVELGPEHWEIIHLLRDFNQRTGLSPAMRILVRLVKENLGADKGNSIHLLRLFPGSPAKIAAKIAGLPRPSNCL